MVPKLPYLTDEHHYAIARLAVYGAELDHVIELTVDVMFRNTPNTAKAVITNLTTDRLLGVLDALLADKYPTEAAQHSQMVADIKATRLDRNQVMHSLTDETGDDTEIVTFRSRRPYRKETDNDMSAKDIYDIALKMMDLNAAMYRLCRREGWPFQKPQPSPGT